jgi:ubiquinone/menaquinone biosynthesis C-methylase UbiE
MRRPLLIARQSAAPSGILGGVIARIMAYETATLNERALRLLFLRPSDRVLEVGFGHGRTVARLASSVTLGHVAGIDVSETMTRLAMRRNRRAMTVGRVDLRTGSCASLPFADGQFDKALSVHTLYFFTDPQACFREVSRVLRPGGRFVLGFMGRNARHSSRFPAEVYTFYDEEQIQRLLLAASFGSLEFERVGESTLMVATR